MQKFTLLAVVVILLQLGLRPIQAGDTNDFQARENRADAEAMRLLSQMTLQEKLLQLLAYKPNGVPRLGIPSLRAGEALHGVTSEGCTSFPQSIALGATFDPALVGEIGKVIAQEARAVGVVQVYAPMLGVARDPRWGRVEESYGEDPLLVSRLGVAYINGAQGQGNARFGKENIITTAKHFAADGEPWAGANGEGFETSERTLREIFLPPFEAAVKEAHTGSIMAAHHALNGVPCHANSWLLETLLRQAWGFDGFVTSDMGDIPKLGIGGGFGGYHYVRDDYESAIASLKAGVDMELIGQLYMTELPKAVNAGTVSEAVVNRAAERVLRAKILLLGLGEPQTNALAPTKSSSGNSTEEVIVNYQGKDDIWARLIADGKFSTPESSRQPNWRDIVNNSAHDALALRAAQEAIVLLKNQNNLLPLDRAAAKKILVVGPLAEAVNLGNYSPGKPKFYVNVVEGLKAVGGSNVVVSYSPGCPMMPHQNNRSRRDRPEAPESPEALAARTKSLLAEAVQAARGADVVVAVVGHTRDQLRENLDRDTLDLPGGQMRLVEAMQATGKPVVVVVNSGNVFSMDWIQEHVPAIVQAFYLGQSTGTALAQVLFGDVNPGGKMPITTPRNFGQLPCYYNHPMLTGPVNYYGSQSGPLFAFGHGLSYTTFNYSDLKVNGPISREKPATISLMVENTGQHAGDEVVQLYLRQDYTSLTRPVKELEGFQRLTLLPGQKREVSFLVGFEQIKFWKDNGWVAEPGEIQIMIGAASDDIRLKGTAAYVVQ